MSKGFYIDAKLRIKGPIALTSVINKIKSQLKNLDFKVNVDFNSKTSAQVSKLSTQIDKLTVSLSKLTPAANSAAGAVTLIGNAISSTQGNAQVLSKNFTAVTRSAKELEKPVRESARAVTSFGEMVGITSKRFSAFVIAMGAIGSALTGIRSGFESALKFERELIRLKQVGGDASHVIEGISDEITRLSTSLGVSSEGLSKTAVTLRQAGLSALETKKALDALAKTELAPTFDNIESTTEGVIAIMSQFKVQANDLNRVLSSINSVSAQYAVESSDIVEGIKRAGGAFKAAGGNLNEFLALFTSIRSTTREGASTISSGLNTIFARLQRPDLLTKFRKLGIELSDEKGQFIGPYKAIQKLNQALREIPSTDTRFAAIREEIAGIRQLAKVTPLITEFSKAEEALNVALSNQNSLNKDSVIAQGALLNKVGKLKEELLSLFRVIANDVVFNTLISKTLDAAIAVTRLVKSLAPLVSIFATLGTFALLKGATSFLPKVAAGISAIPNLKRATGGPIPGSGNSDSVPAVLTPGEFVIKKSSAQRIGYSKLDRMNKYATGGRVNNFQGMNSDSHFFPPHAFVDDERKGYAGGGLVGRKNLVSLLENLGVPIKLKGYLRKSYNVPKIWDGGLGRAVTSTGIMFNNMNDENPVRRRETLLHELGHMIDFRYYAKGKKPKHMDFASKHDADFMKISDNFIKMNDIYGHDTFDEYPDHRFGSPMEIYDSNEHHKEGFANAFMAYMEHKAYNSGLKTHHAVSYLDKMPEFNEISNTFDKVLPRINAIGGRKFKPYDMMTSSRKDSLIYLMKQQRNVNRGLNDPFANLFGGRAKFSSGGQVGKLFLRETLDEAGLNDLHTEGYVRKIFGANIIGRPTIEGIAYPRSGIIGYKKSMKPSLIKRTLAHELGHMIDYDKRNLKFLSNDPIHMHSDIANIYQELHKEGAFHYENQGNGYTFGSNLNGYGQDQKNKEGFANGFAAYVEHLRLNKGFNGHGTIANLQGNNKFKGMINLFDWLLPIIKRQGKSGLFNREEIKKGTFDFRNLLRKKFASGGQVDSVPAMLTPGEFVLNKSASQSIGYQNLKHMNSGGKVGMSSPIPVNTDQYIKMTIKEIGDAFHKNSTPKEDRKEVFTDIFKSLIDQIKRVNPGLDSSKVDTQAKGMLKKDTTMMMDKTGKFFGSLELEDKSTKELKEKSKKLGEVYEELTKHYKEFLASNQPHLSENRRTKLAEMAARRNITTGKDVFDGDPLTFGTGGGFGEFKGRTDAFFRKKLGKFGSKINLSTDKISKLGGIGKVGLGAASLLLPSISHQLLGTAEEPGAFGQTGAMLGDAVSSGISGATVGATIGSSIGPWGTAIFGMIGAITGATSSILGFGEEMDKIKKNKLEEGVINAMSNINTKTGKFTDVTGESQAAFGELNKRLLSPYVNKRGTFFGNIDVENRQEQRGEKLKVFDQFRSLIMTLSQSEGNAGKSIEELIKDNDSLKTTLGALSAVFPALVTGLRKVIDDQRKFIHLQHEADTAFGKLAFSLDKLAVSSENVQENLEKTARVQNVMREAFFSGTPSAGGTPIGLNQLGSPGQELFSATKPGGDLEKVRQTLIDELTNFTGNPLKLDEVTDKLKNQDIFKGDFGKAILKSIAAGLGDVEKNQDILTEVRGGNFSSIKQLLGPAFDQLNDIAKSLTQNLEKVTGFFHGRIIENISRRNELASQRQEFNQFGIGQEAQGATRKILQQPNLLFERGKFVSTQSELARAQSFFANKQAINEQSKFGLAGPESLNPEAIVNRLNSAQNKLGILQGAQKENPADFKLMESIGSTTNEISNLRNALKNLSTSTILLDAAQGKLQVALDKEAADKEGREKFGELSLFGNPAEQMKFAIGDMLTQFAVQSGIENLNLPQRLMVREHLENNRNTVGNFGVTDENGREGKIQATGEELLKKFISPYVPESLINKTEPGGSTFEQKALDSVISNMTRASELFSQITDQAIFSNIQSDTELFDQTLKSLIQSINDAKADLAKNNQKNLPAPPPIIPPAVIPKPVEEQGWWERNIWGRVKVKQKQFMQNFANGGNVLSKGTDTVPAMLTPGEFIVSSGAAKKNSSLLRGMNSGVRYMADGGWVMPGRHKNDMVGPMPTIEDAPSFRTDKFGVKKWLSPQNQEDWLKQEKANWQKSIQENVERQNDPRSLFNTLPKKSPKEIEQSLIMEKRMGVAHKERAREIEKRGARRQKLGLPEYIPISKRIPDKMSNAFNDTEGNRIHTENLRRRNINENREFGAQNIGRGGGNLQLQSITNDLTKKSNDVMTDHARAINKFVDNSGALITALNSFPKEISIKREGTIQVVFNGLEVMNKIKGDLEKYIYQTVIAAVEKEAIKAFTKQAL